MEFFVTIWKSREVENSTTMWAKSVIIDSKGVVYHLILIIALSLRAPTVVCGA